MSDDSTAQTSEAPEVVTALLDARQEQDDLEAQRMRRDVERRLFDVAADPVRIGRYVVSRRVGGGGVGVVYAAHDPELGRDVAVKLLQPSSRHGKAAADAQERLVREARAMARLSHPNVIAVYEVGRYEEQVYIAMELVEGVELREWMKAERDWRRVRDMFIAAGRGLAAAHDAGLVHRDFKPSNVLVGDDGRARVLDFGLAKLATDDRPPSSTSGLGLDVAAMDLTRSGAVMGTPAYMAPEQHMGEAVDARGDQYAFCVSLYEALYGVRPFAGHTVAELCHAKLDLHLTPPKSTPPGVPAWLDRVVRRGLAPEPADRYGSMGELIAALDRDPGRTARRGGVAGIAALGVAGAVFAWGRAGVDPCAATDDELAGIWDAQVQADVAAAFAATDQAFVGPTLDAVQSSLDDYAEKWQTRRGQLCRDEQAHEGGDPRLLQRRMCLDRKRSALAEMTRLLARADARVAENAAYAIAALPDPADCDRPSAMPAHWEELDQDRVREIDALISRGRALDQAAKLDDALAVGNEAVELARTTGYADGEARARLLVGEIEDALGHTESAESSLLQAVEIAERIHDDRTGAMALSELAYTVGVGGGRHDEALRWARFADAKLDRLGDDPVAESNLATYRGILLEQTGKYELALQSHRAAIEIRRARYGDGTLSVASSLSNMGSVLVAQAKYAEALETFREALGVYERVLGPDHPATVSPRGNVATALIGLGRGEEAEAELRRALTVLERAFGPDHPSRAITLNNLGSILKRRGDAEGALKAYEEALRVGEKVLGPRHPTTCGFHTNVGATLMDLGRPDEAMAHHEAALDGWRESLGADHPNLAYAHYNIGLVHRAAGRIDEARAAIERAVGIRQKALGPDHPMTVEARATLEDLGK